MRTKSMWASLAVFVAAVAVWAADNKGLTIEDIMDKCHATKKGIRDVVKEAAAKPSPDWPDIQKKTKEFVELASLLDKQKPPMGEEKSWKKLCTEYVGMVKELDAAAGKKDPKAVDTAIKKLGANCKACHDEHRP